MKDSSQLRKEFERLKEAYENAQKRKKKAKSAYKSQMKASKSQLKPYKLAYKHAQLAEHEAKVEYKALLKESKKYEDDSREMDVSPANEATSTGRGRRGRQPKAVAPVTAGKPAGRGRGRRRAAELVASSDGNDLTKVVGVGAKVAAALQAHGIHTFEDMASTSLDTYKAILREAGMGKFRNPTTWAQQAADLAGVDITAPAPPAPKEPKRRGRQPGAAKAVAPKVGTRGKKVAAEKPVGKPRGRRRAVEASATSGGDDLTKVVGVGDKVAVALRANGINSFADMAATSLARYKEILKDNGMSKFRNPTTWAQQAAAMAGVEAVQEPAKPAAVEPASVKRRPGRQPGFKPTPKAKTAAAAAPVAAESEPVKKRRGRQPGFKPTPKAKTAAAAAPVATESEPVKKRRGRQPGFKPTPKAKTAAAAPVAAEGEPVKKRRGRQPGFKPTPKAKMVEVVAESVKRSRGAVKNAAPTAAAPAVTARNASGSDDLTKIKGIGDRVQTALNEFGIYSYADVAGTSLDRFKEILKARGMSKFRDPSGWAQNAAEMVR